MCGDHKFNPIRPFEGSWDQIWPTGTLLGPPKSPKGPFGAKTSPFRAPLGPKGARYQVKVCGDHESNPGGVIGGRWDQICPPRALRGPLGLHKGPLGAQTNPFFCCFLQLEGSIWAKTVMDEQGILLRWSGYPRSLYFKQKKSHKIGLWKFRDWVQITLFWPLGTLKGPDIRSNCVVTISLTPSDHLRAVGTKSGPPRPSLDLLSPQKGLSGPKRALLGPP